VGWLALGVAYSFAYVLVGWVLSAQPTLLSWFRVVALLIPPLAGAWVIVSRRHTWRGCQWLFWSTIALGLAMSAMGLTGWAADELMMRHATWLAWPSVFALFGSLAPLFALLAQPHRGTREPLAATTAVDIAGLAVVTGFLYSFFVTAPDPSASDSAASVSLLLVAELQQVLVVAGMAAAMFIARRSPWRETYKRLAFGALVGFATLTISNIEMGQIVYRSAFVYDFTWILPFAFVPWAASAAPTSDEEESQAEETAELTRPRPWVIFVAVSLIPFLDYALRRILPNTSLESFRDLSTAVTIISVLPLLVARIAAERAEMQQAGGTMRILNQVIEQARDSILVLTADGRCRHANEAFCRGVGLRMDELVGRPFRSLIADERLSADDIRSLVRAGGTWHGTLTRVRADGSTFPVSATIAALSGKDGDVTHLVSVERDISEDRRFLQQLIHSERLSAVGHLVAGVAHEINNPLQGMMGATELLIAAEQRADVRADLEQIRNDGARAATIVQNLLAFVQRSTIDRSIADLNEIARAVTAARASELRAADATLALQLADDLPMIAANRENIERAVLNLVMNAEGAVASAKRGGTITLRTRQNGQYVALDVIDDGPGVPPELAGRVFEPFFTTKAVGKGTGLGLSVALGIAEAHAGMLVLTPTDHGACFTLTLPVAAMFTDQRSAFTAIA